jgi:hypothetical protein
MIRMNERIRWRKTSGKRFENKLSAREETEKNTLGLTELKTEGTRRNTFHALVDKISSSPLTKLNPTY